MKKFTAGANEDGVRLSRFVEGVTSGLPRSLLYKSFRNKRVKVNGRRAEPDARLAAGDVIELYINDEFFPEKTRPAAKPARRQPPVTVVYEDADIAVLYKPAHLLCHSDRTGDANLIDAFTAQLAAAGQYDPHAEQRFAPALCNRLDRGTEGLVIAAKNYAALRDMNEIIRNDWLKKEYLTITVGAPPAGRHIAWLQQQARRATRSASTRAKAKGTSRSSPMCPCCGARGRMRCVASGLSPGARTRSARTWRIWATRCWAISSTATAK